MSSQGSLFSRAPPKTPSPPKYRLHIEKHEVKNPWGKSDGKGNLFWQKMHKELEKMPVEIREHFNYLTIGARPEHLDAFEKALRLLRSASEFDRVDFDVSRGMLREGL